MAEVQTQPFESEISERVQQMRDALSAGKFNLPSTAPATEMSAVDVTDSLPVSRWGQWANWASWTKVM